MDSRYLDDGNGSVDDDPDAGITIATHAIRRARDRYGIVLAFSDCQKLERRIAERDHAFARPMTSLGPRGEAWLVSHAGVWLVAVVRGGRIRTFLPLGVDLREESEWKTGTMMGAWQRAATKRGAG